ncbi:DUF3325 domain-containing protein [Stutzerimonas kirkiae]|uniref:DUF3325 domain-containing protein n=1 Tax=Stutzerimonas kirkiae TaxID=2211392 RepID=A0A4Q9R7J0_9GAMM|nr:DUF3325 domain-containing protein [Stutzerimonas kirkiae]TBU96577.1 DUF3325 domain-containing protein [Stutzerimonas kirkiae]TBV02140.1 DUF3325 domain-containing protein [Stutzerimonas kirkiae]TBV15645.1 DUF3325 domain-containing protein [Stutzerimonas kirkiae]
MIWHLGIFLFSLAGFAALALAMERHCKHLLRRSLPPPWPALLYWSGWALLAVALALALLAPPWRWSMGLVVWLGWLSLAAAGLAFYFPWWPWQPPAAAVSRKGANARVKPVATGPAAPARGGLRSVIRLATSVALVGLPLATLALIASTPEKPLLRADAVRGKVGPWDFTFAEADDKLPTLAAFGTHMKLYQVRFCDACDQEIRNAYLRLRKPRSRRGAGIVFDGSHWNREVEINLPRNTRADDELWLTVEGKDGSVHQASIPLAAASPAFSTWLRTHGGEASKRP